MQISFRDLSDPIPGRPVFAELPVQPCCWLTSEREGAHTHTHKKITQFQANKTDRNFYHLFLFPSRLLVFLEKKWRVGLGLVWPTSGNRAPFYIFWRWLLAWSASEFQHPVKLGCLSSFSRCCCFYIVSWLTVWLAAPWQVGIVSLNAFIMVDASLS